MNFEKKKKSSPYTKLLPQVAVFLRIIPLPEVAISATSAIDLPWDKQLVWVAILFEENIKKYCVHDDMDDMQGNKFNFGA